MRERMQELKWFLGVPGTFSLYQLSFSADMTTFSLIMPAKQETRRSCPDHRHSTQSLTSVGCDWEEDGANGCQPVDPFFRELKEAKGFDC